MDVFSCSLRPGRRALRVRRRDTVGVVRLCSAPMPDVPPLPETRTHADPAWVRQCMPGLRALLLRLTRDVQLANDLMQEVLLAVMMAQREQRIEKPEALTAYIHQTARNRVLMWQRKATPEPMAELPEHESAWAESPKSPLECCEEHELGRLALQALQSLPVERDRELIVGFYVKAKSKAQLMEEYGLTREHFDRVISRARFRMRDLLHELMNPDSGAVGDSSAQRTQSSSSTRFDK
jgi:RNA polymerase sigma factor (sigma-70 family)